MNGSIPFDDIGDLLDRMSQEFDAESFGITTSAPVDVRDDDDAFVVSVDLPGYDTESIDVTLSDSTLNIEAHRETDTETASGDYIRRERQRRSVSRSVRLPANVEEEGVEASYSNGVLTVTLPKRDTGEGRSIEIE